MQRDAHDSPNRVLKIEVGLVVKSKLGSKSLHIYAFANSTRYFIVNRICYVNVIQSIVICIVYLRNQNYSEWILFITDFIILLYQILIQSC